MFLRLFRQLTLFGILVSVISLSLIQDVYATKMCSDTGYTIMTVNGIFTDDVGAKKNADALRNISSSTFNNESLIIDYLVNPSHLAGAGDLLKSIQQKLSESWWVVRGYDFNEMLKDASERVETKKLLLVAHSQGNFYANSFYDYVTDVESYVPRESIGIYGVATPASRISGDGMWITSDTDKAIAGWVSNLTFKNILEPNTSIQYDESESSNGHGFSDVYLKYRGDRIVSEIKESLDRLSTIPQDTRVVCIEEPNLGLIGSVLHNITGATLAVLNPTSELVKEGVGGVYNSASMVVRETGKAVYNVADFAVGSTASILKNVFVNDGDENVPTGVDRVSSNTASIIGLDSSSSNENSRTSNVTSSPPNEVLSDDGANSAEVEIIESSEDENEAEFERPQPSAQITQISPTNDERIRAELEAELRKLEKQLEIALEIERLEKQLKEVRKQENEKKAEANEKEQKEQENAKPDKIEIDLNIATLEELQELSGIGPVTAQRIIDYRNQYGNFQTIDDIIKVGGIGDVTFQNIKDNITVGGVSGNDSNNVAPEKKSENSASSNAGQSAQSSNGGGGNATSSSSPSISATVALPNTVRADEEIIFAVSISNLEDDSYDIKASIEADGTILSNTLNDGEWKSSNFYIIGGILGPTVSGENLHLKIRENNQDFRGSADLIIRVRKTGTTSAETIFSGKINIIAPKGDDTDIANIEDEEFEEEKEEQENAKTDEIEVNINTAMLEELQELSGIGPVIAQRIIDYRNQHGLFINIEDIMNVNGIGLATFEKIKDYITVGIVQNDDIGGEEEGLGFAVTYHKDNLALDFSWDGEEGEIFKIKDKDTGEYIFETDTDADYVDNFSYRINEVARDYSFSIYAYDLEGVEIASENTDITIPSFIKNVEFYNADHYSGGEIVNNDLIEFSYDDYPFLPMDLVYHSRTGPRTGPNYKVMVLYLNKPAPKHKFIKGNVPHDEDLDDTLRIEYRACSGGITFNPSIRLADYEEVCSTSNKQANGSMRYDQYFAEHDGNHLLLPVEPNDNEITLSTGDYFTIAFYGYYRDYPVGSSEDFAFNNFKLLAVDNTKYNFSDEIPQHQPPDILSEPILEFDEQTMVLTTSYEMGNDPDTRNSLLRYEISYDDGETWEETKGLSADRVVEPETEYLIQIRAIDDFGLESEPRKAVYTTPITDPPFGLSNIVWGNIEGLDDGIGVSFDYESYPFIPDKNGKSRYDSIVFYLNQLPPFRYGFNVTAKSSHSQAGVGYRGCSGTHSLDKLILLRGENCSEGSGTLGRRSLPPPDFSESGNITLSIPRLYNSEKQIDELSEDDYITIGFYNITGIGVWTPGSLSLVGNDTNRYYFTPAPEPAPEEPDEE